jgi:hypothetical protein
MIQITFTPETPEQTAAVAEAMVKYMAATAPGGTVAEVKDPAVETPKTRKAGTFKSARPNATDEPAPVSASATGEAEVPNATPADTPTDSPTASTASSPERITLEDIRGVLAKLSQGGKAAEVKGLIAKFGAKKLTDITADKYADLMAQAEAL